MDTAPSDDMELLDDTTEQIYDAAIAGLISDRPTPAPPAWMHVISAADWMFELVADLDDRETSAAEANMADVLVVCAKCFESGDQSRIEQLNALLRLAIIDLNHGWDLDVDDTGNSLMEASLELLALLTALWDEPVNDRRFISLLRLTAAKIRGARVRDLGSHVGENGPVTVLRPGIGGVENPVPSL